MTGAEYTKDRLLSGKLTDEDLERLVKFAQRALGVMPDGYFGPVSTEFLRRSPDFAPPAPVAKDELKWEGPLNAWLMMGPDVKITPFHPSWYSGPLATVLPKGIVVHTTDTQPGTAGVLAKQRQVPFGTDPDIHVGSWHFTIETDGTIYQNVPVTHSAWHGGSPSARQLPTGWANYSTLGIELVSPNDKGFPGAQVAGAVRLWRALVKRFGIPRGLAMIPHGGFDPERRVDPGAEWMGESPPFAGAMKFLGPVGGHAKTVLDAAYAP